MGVKRGFQDSRVPVEQSACVGASSPQYPGFGAADVILPLAWPHQDAISVSTFLLAGAAIRYITYLGYCLWFFNVWFIGLVDSPGT